MIRVLTQKAEIQYGILLTRSELRITPDIDVDVCFADRVYHAHSHKTQEGRIGRLTKFI